VFTIDFSAEMDEERTRNELRPLFNCPLCKEVVADPVRLRLCGHTCKLILLISISSFPVLLCPNLLNTVNLQYKIVVFTLIQVVFNHFMLHLDNFATICLRNQFYFEKICESTSEI
jgi:hypothetical protein